MTKKLLRLAFLAFLFGCKDGDPCSNFIVESDLEIHQSLHCAANCGSCIHLQANLNQLIEEEERYDLTFSWIHNGITYEPTASEDFIVLPAGSSGVATLIVQNVGCSLEIEMPLGNYDFESPAQGGLIGNTVWLDDKHGDGSNINILDSGDERIPDIRVDLLLASDSSLVMQTNTDEYGWYLFSNVKADDYLVRFHKPPGMEFVLQTHGLDNSVDSDCNPFGYTYPFTLDHCEVNLKIDAGLKD